MKKTKPGTRPKFENTRKLLRKQKRQQKKVHRQEHYLKKNVQMQLPEYTGGRFVKRPADSAEPNAEVKVLSIRKVIYVSITKYLDPKLIMKILAPSRSV